MLWVRHGETAVNVAGLLLGRRDPPLTDRGRRQVEAAAPIVAAARPVRILTSPLARARETAAILAGACGAVGVDVEVEVEERAVELDYGVWEGTRLSDLPPAELTRWRADVEHRPPGGESLADVGRRVAGLCAELAEGQGADSTNLVVVSHVSPIKAAACWAVGIDQSAAWRLHLDLASVTRIGVRSGVPFLERFNEVAPVAEHRPD
jgi:probable phosphoglycerate mutase